MYCPKCGAKLVETAVYCHACGTPVEDSYKTIVIPRKQPISYRALAVAGGILGAALIAAIFSLADYLYQGYNAQPRESKQVAEQRPTPTPQPKATPTQSATPAIASTMMATEPLAPTPEPKVRNTPLPAPVASAPSPGKPVVARATPEPQPTPEAIAQPHPTPEAAPDSSKILGELLSIERLMHNAMETGDNETLRRIIADEFINIAPSGKTSGKGSFTNIVNPILQNFRLENPHLNSARSNTATIQLIKTFCYPQGYVRTLDTDRFIWRDGRWQITYSRSTGLRTQRY